MNKCTSYPYEHLRETAPTDPADLQIDEVTIDAVLFRGISSSTKRKFLLYKTSKCQTCDLNSDATVLLTIKHRLVLLKICNRLDLIVEPKNMEPITSRVVTNTREMPTNQGENIQTKGKTSWILCMF
jgi:hypothetical protein